MDRSATSAPNTKSLVCAIKGQSQRIRHLIIKESYRLFDRLTTPTLSPDL